VRARLNGDYKHTVCVSADGSNLPRRQFLFLKMVPQQIGRGVETKPRKKCNRCNGNWTLVQHTRIQKKKKMGRVHTNLCRNNEKCLWHKLSMERARDLLSVGDSLEVCLDGRTYYSAIFVLITGRNEKSITTFPIGFPRVAYRNSVGKKKSEMKFIFLKNVIHPIRNRLNGK
jgi:hypothetical protein